MPRTDTRQSRQRLLEASIDLLRGQGLAGIGINDVVRASGAPKGSVYHFFPGGKAQIAHEALSAYAPRVRAFIEEALDSRDTPPERVRALFDAFARRVEQADFSRSCPIGTVSLDLGADEEGLQHTLAAALADWADAIARRVDLGDPARTRSYARLLLTAIEGAYVRARAERSGRPFREAGEWLARLAA